MAFAHSGVLSQLCIEGPLNKYRDPSDISKENTLRWKVSFKIVYRISEVCI